MLPRGYPVGVSGPGGFPPKKESKKKAPIEELNVRWVIGPAVRADLLSYSGVDITGGQFIAQIYASGARTGTLDGERMRSIVIGASYGTRIVLCTTTDETIWEDQPWRCIRLVDGQTYHTSDGTPAVRVPDLEWLDKYDARKAKTDNQVSYPFAATMADGKGWTFGRPGALHNRIRMIRVEHEDRPAPRGVPEPEPEPAE